MSAEDKFNKAKDATETLQQTRDYVKEARDTDEDMVHSPTSEQAVKDAIDFLIGWKDKLTTAGCDAEDVERIDEAIEALSVFAAAPNKSDNDALADELKDLYYTMVAHTTMLYAKKEREDTLHREDDHTYQ